MSAYISNWDDFFSSLDLLESNTGQDFYGEHCILKGILKLIIVLNVLENMHEQLKYLVLNTIN